MHHVVQEHQEHGQLKAEFFSCCGGRLQDGSMFKAQVEYAPYLYLQVKVRSAKTDGREVKGRD
jgi:hypothetical protein